MNKGILIPVLFAFVACSKSHEQLPNEQDRTRRLSLATIPESMVVREQIIGYMDNDSTHERIKYVGVMTYETNRYPYYGAIHSVHNEYLTDFIGVCAESGCVYHGSSTISETKDSSIFPGSKAIDVKIKEDTRYYSIDSVHCVIRVRDCRYQTDRIGRIMNQYDFVTSTYK